MVFRYLNERVSTCGAEIKLWCGADAVGKAANHQDHREAHEA